MRAMLIGAALLCSAAWLGAQGVVVFDRGLPSTNLNNASGSSRSNVAWGFTEGDPNVDGSYAAGDTFNLGQQGTITADDIRVWLVGSGSSPLSSEWSNFTLFLGDTSGSITSTSTVGSVSGPGVTITPTTYPGGASYQGTYGGYDTLYQVDFLGNWTINGSQNYTFFVGGTPTATNIGEYGPNGASPFLSASNAALSDNCGGCTQQGADNTLYGLEYGAANPANDGIWTWDSNGNGWDKSSDVNVEVFAVPEGGSAISYILLAGFALFGALVIARRRTVGAPAN